MQETQHGEWENREQLIEGYQRTLALLEARCRQLEAEGARNEDGEPCDVTGTIDEYRRDAQYCARQIAWLSQGSRARADDESLRGQWREVPMDPKDLALWAWQNPWKQAQSVPGPKDAIAQLRTSELLERFTQKEAEVLILVEGLGMTAPRAARLLRCSERTVYNLLASARKRFGEDMPG